MADSATYTPEAIARRLQIAQQLLDTSKSRPVQHWAQGLDELAKGAIGGAMFGQGEEMERKSRYDSNAAMLSALGLPAPAPYVPQWQSPVDRIAGLFGGRGTAAPPPDSVAPPPDSLATPAPSPTTAAPASAMPPPVQPAPTAIPMAPPRPPADIPSVAGPAVIPNTAQMGDARARLAAMLRGDAPAATVATRPEVMPSDKVWGDKEAEAAGLYEPLPGAKPAARPSLAPAFAPGPLPAAAPPAPSVAPAAPPAPVTSPPEPSQPASLTSSIPEAKRRQIAALLSNPGTQAMGQSILMAAINKEGSFEPLTDPRQRAAAGIGPDDKTPYQVDRQTGKVSAVNTAPITNVALNTALKGQEKAAEMAVTEFQGAQTAGREAAKRSGIWDSMEQASRGFTPGATADIKLTAGRYLKDLGITAGEGVPDAEVFKQLQQQIAVHAQPKGQGSVSDSERELFAKAIANITMSPEALQRSIAISRGLDEFDRKVAQIYRDSARKNGGVPNSVEVNDQIDALGSPLKASDQTFLQAAIKSGGAPAATGGPPAPDRAAIEAEMKRRGMAPK